MTRIALLSGSSRRILVNAVAPGVVETDMTRPVLEQHAERALRRILLGRFGFPEEIAAVVGFLASEEASYITGQIIAVDGGFGMNP